MLFTQFVPYRNRPLCFCDIETTGTKAGVHEVIEIAFKHDTLGSWSTTIQPEFLNRAEPEALLVSRYNTVDWAGSPTFREVAPKITQFVTDATVIGHNLIGFDVQILRGHYEICGLSHHGLFRDALDTMVLARTVLIPQGLKRLNMEACRKFFGRGYEGAHAAWEDCVFAEELYHDIMENLRWVDKRKGEVIQESLFDG